MIENYKKTLTEKLRKIIRNQKKRDQTEITIIIIEITKIINLF